MDTLVPPTSLETFKYKISHLSVTLQQVEDNLTVEKRNLSRKLEVQISFIIIIVNEQHGFLYGKSISTNLSLLVSSNHLLDFTKAYDRINKKTPYLGMLKRYGMLATQLVLQLSSGHRNSILRLMRVCNEVPRKQELYASLHQSF
ncbi:hypothetical protein J6590_061947 [Homalodisca vitripennis]|nr:hypothetical protein J6590_061947 [Homalodisca vitripennis]